MSGLSSTASVPRRRRAVRWHRCRLQHPAAHQGAPVPEQLRHQQARRYRLAGTPTYISEEHRLFLVAHFIL